MAGAQNLLIALWLSACAGAVPAKAPPSERAPSEAERAAAARAKKYALDLPQATNTIGWPEFDVPHVALSGTKVFVDDAEVEDVSELVAGGRLKRLDGLFHALRRRGRGQAQGVVVFWLGAATPA